MKNLRYLSFYSVLNPLSYSYTSLSLYNCSHSGLILQQNPQPRTLIPARSQPQFPHSKLSPVYAQPSKSYCPEIPPSISHQSFLPSRNQYYLSPHPSAPVYFFSEASSRVPIIGVGLLKAYQRAVQHRGRLVRRVRTRDRLL